jgi:hypothetical protein
LATAEEPDLIFDSAFAASVKPHLDWFLIYLSRVSDVDREHPCLTVYAFQAFLMAWRLFRARLDNVFEAVGIKDHDLKAAIDWAQRVFGRRSSWKVGRLIVSNLDSVRDSNESL